MARGILRLLLTLPLLGALSACSDRADAPVAGGGAMTIYAAGSLAVPLSELIAAYREEHPELDINLELSGSVVAVRKLTDLRKVPDLLAVADYSLLPKLAFPDHATWGITFATNAMVLAYGDRSAGADSITAANWPEILARPGVRWGVSDPEQDPAGYRARMSIELMEQVAGPAGMAERLLAGDNILERPKSADLMALVQLGELDYAWAYRSLAMQSGLPFVELDPRVNLGDPTLADGYARVSVAIPRTGGEPAVIAGEPIGYALTIPDQAPNGAAARQFVRFMLSDRGREILRGTFLAPLERPALFGDPPGWLLN